MSLLNNTLHSQNNRSFYLTSANSNKTFKNLLRNDDYSNVYNINYN